jgi:capsular polysaccharide biosynthesis protein
MNEEEVQIDLMTLLHYILRKWRSIIVVMLIVAVAANLYSVKKSMSEAAAVSTTEEVDIEKQIENAKEELTADELEQVEHVYSMYEYNSQLYQESKEYLEKSVLMQLNPNEIPTVMLNYQFKKDQADEELSNIFTMYENALLDEDTCTAIIQVFGEEYANTSVRELISVTDTENGQNSDTIKFQKDKNSGILSIQIYAGSEEQCEQVAEIVKKRVLEYTEQLQQIFGNYTVNAISEQYYISSESNLNMQKSDAVNAVNDVYTALKNISSGLSEKQMTYYNLLVNESSDQTLVKEDTEETENMTANVQYISMKYILIGLLAGMFLAVCWYAVVYIMTQTVKDVDEVKIITNLPVFGTVLGSNENGKRNIIDRWIDSWFAHDKKSENNELLLTRISHEVAMLAGQKDKRNLLVACSESDQNLKKQADSLVEKLRELGMNVTSTDSLVSDNTEVLKQLESADSAVFVEQLMKSERNQIREAVELCRRCQVEVLGSVIVGSDSY